MAQTEFDRQAEVTRLLLEGISSTHVSPLPTSSFLIHCHHSCPYSAIMRRDCTWTWEAGGEGQCWSPRSLSREFSPERASLEGARVWQRTGWEQNALSRDTCPVTTGPLPHR